MEAVYSGAIPLDKMVDILDIVEGGGNTNSIRMLLCKYLLSRYVLTAADIWNFKNRALRLQLNSDSIRSEDVEELLQFEGLDADSSIKIGRDIASHTAPINYYARHCKTRTCHGKWKHI
jgi:hypothetical protein